MKIKPQRMKISTHTHTGTNTTRTRLAALAASVVLAVSPAVHAATMHTSIVTANNTNVVLDSGDTISVTSTDTATALDAVAVNTHSNSTIDMGTGSTVNAMGRGLRAYGTNSVITADKITVTVGTEAEPSTMAFSGVYAQAGAQISLGSGSVINLHGVNTGQEHRGIFAYEDNSVVTADSGLVLRVTSIGDINNGASADRGGTLHLGTGANIEAERALQASNKGTITATGGQFRGVGENGYGIQVTGGTLTLTGSEVWGEKYGINVASTSAGEHTTGNVTISGGTVSSGSDTVIKGANPAAANPTDVTVTFTDGAQAASAAGDNGYLYQADAGVSAEASVSVVIDGADTTVAGRFLTEARRKSSTEAETAHTNSTPPP
ncbi:MAG: hypothetical protein LBK99_01260 [Opitutaceae bacterium]|jgi:hypothetical protein|nr:hypothetical protein [Opitutaceae bacterium]